MALTTDIDALVARIATQTAVEISTRAAKLRLHYVNERDHLQPACLLAASTEAAKYSPPVVAKPGWRFQSPLWPRLGAVDIALMLSEERPIALELKCGGGRHALGPCAWDVLKIAFALQVGAISHGYLIAATRAEDWSRAFPGTELFDSATIDTRVLYERFGEWWRHWEGLGDPVPRKVPAQMSTRAVCTTPFRVAGVPWQLKVAAVEIDVGEPIIWPPRLSDALERMVGDGSDLRPVSDEELRRRLGGDTTGVVGQD
jgi:hypothetical protein